MNRLRQFWPLLLIVAAVIAMTLIFLIGFTQSVWFDEAYSLLLARQPVPELVRLTSIDVHPPFYYLLLKGWISLFGESTTALRSLGALIGGAVIIVAGLLIKRQFGVRALALSLPFVTFAPFLIRYGFELRMYALAVLIGLVATLLLVTATDRSRHKATKYWAAYALVVALGLYTAYYLALLWVAHFVWLTVMTLRTAKRTRSWRWVFSYIGAAVLFVPWLPTFIAQISNGALANISQPLTIENLSSLLTLTVLYRPIWQLEEYSGVIVVVLSALLAWLGYMALRHEDKSTKQSLGLFAAYVFVPVVIIMIISLFRPFYVERYVVPVIVAAYILMGVTIAVASRTNHRAASVLGGVLLIGLLAGTVQVATAGNYNFQRLQKPDINLAVDRIGNCSPEEVILAADPYVAIEVYALRHSSCQVRFMSNQDQLRGGYAPLASSNERITSPNELRGFTKIYFAYYDEPKYSPPNGYAVTETNGRTMHVQTWRR